MHEDDAQPLALIERRGLVGTRIGWVDAHLLASALIAPAFLWTMEPKGESMMAIGRSR